MQSLKNENNFAKNRILYIHVVYSLLAMNFRSIVNPCNFVLVRNV